MKGSCKSLEVFEFREEDERADVAARTISNKFRSTLQYCLSDRVNRGAEILLKEFCAEMHEDANDAKIDQKCDVTSSFNPSENEDISNKNLSEINCDLPANKYKTHEIAAEVEYNILESEMECHPVECSLNAGATTCLEDQENYAFSAPSVNDVLPSVESDEEDSRSSSDGPSPDNCFNDYDLADNMMDIVFYTDYVDYSGMHYPDSVVSFSCSFVEFKSRTTNGIKRSFHLQLEIDDIVKIESQWSARYGAGTIKICFSSQGVMGDETVYNGSVSVIHELKFPAVDSRWYEKREAIESLNIRYKSLWIVLLDIEMNSCTHKPGMKALMFKRSYFPNFDKPFDEVIYPKGDPDAVSISKRDIDLLLPDTFVNDTIIDFYIKYLKNKQSAADRIKFHFFNSFFFRKLADMDKDPSSAFDGKAAFQRVRKWTRKVNLLEKDFIFIPVNYNYHWSLIVICYFGEIASITDDTADKLNRVPCILHMDSFRGSHVGLKDLLQSYLWEEWKERHNETCKEIYLKFRNLKFVSPELPQQQNLYDCGLFLLHYVELFLEDVPANFSIYSITSSSNFLQVDWFPPGEASMKRAHIERLIYELLEPCCSPSSGSDKDGSPNDFKTSTDHENGQVIEMTLLPSSSISTVQCYGNSELTIHNLFEPGCALKPLDHVSSLDGLRQHVPLSETEITEPVFQHAVGLTQGETLFSFTSSDFRLQHGSHIFDYGDCSPVTAECDSEDESELESNEKCQSFEAVGLNDEREKNKCMVSETIKCSSVCLASASAEMINAAESCSLVGINDCDGDSLILKKMPEFFQEKNQMQDNVDFSHELSQGDVVVGVTACDGPDHAVNGNGCAYPCSHASEGRDIVEGVENLPVSDFNELRAAKRMRVSVPSEVEEITHDLSNDVQM